MSWTFSIYFFCI